MMKLYRLTDPEVSAAPRYLREMRGTLTLIEQLLQNAEGFTKGDIGDCAASRRLQTMYST